MSVFEPKIIHNYKTKIIIIIIIIIITQCLFKCYVKIKKNVVFFDPPPQKGISHTPRVGNIRPLEWYCNLTCNLCHLFLYKMKYCV